MNIVWIILATVVLVNTAVIIAIAKMRTDTFPKNVRDRLLNNMDKLENGLKELSQNSIQADATPDSHRDTISEVQEPTPYPSGIDFPELEQTMRIGMAENIYRDVYLREPVDIFRASQGKAVFIRPEYHHRIMLLLNADDGKCSTFIGFLDNVLSEHFNLNADSINGIIASRYKNPDSL